MPEKTAFDKGRFVVFDGEGMNIDGRHEYIYLACLNSRGVFHDASNRHGLTSEQCFRFLLANAEHDGIHVIYGGSYDANMILRTLTRIALENLHKLGRTKWRGYWIDYIPRKYIGIQHELSMKRVRLWDVIGFFQGSFISSLRLWLDVEDRIIVEGKAARSSFIYTDFDKIKEYCRRELELFSQLMQSFLERVKSMTLKLNRWDGAGAGAGALFRKHNVREAIGPYSLQRPYYEQARLAYAGGRFELFMPGDYQSPVYEYDINSAYPHFMRQLPPFRPLYERPTSGRYPCGCTRLPIYPFDLLHYRYLGTMQTRAHPFFHRDIQGRVLSPYHVEGWTWAPEYLALDQSRRDRVEILDVLHWHDNGQRPFAWIQTEYARRLRLQSVGDRAQHALKLFLNSLYGKLAQQKGWKPHRPTASIPKTHNLYMAGWITSSTRAMIWEAIAMQRDNIISCETDAVFSTNPLELPLGYDLGQWKASTFLEGLTYLQSGIYFANGVSRYRGIDAQSLTRDDILNAWSRMQSAKKPKTTITAPCTRFRTLGTSLAGERLETWRQWIKETKELSLIPTGKRVHIDPLCAIDQGVNKRACRWGVDAHHVTYPNTPSGGDYISKPYSVAWITYASKEKHYQYQEVENEYNIWEEE